MKKIKVAFCLRDMQLGGVESVLIRTLDKLSDYKNIDIQIITYVNIKEPIFIDYFKKHPNIKCFSLYPCSWLSTKLPHFFLWRLCIHFLRDVYRKIRRLFVVHEFKDIDVFVDYHDFGFYDELKHVKDAKKIAWFHSSLDIFIKRKFINKIDIYDNIVVLTDEFIDSFNNVYPNQKNKLIRIYNPIDVENIKKQADKKKSTIKGNYFCCVSRLTPDKDIETLLHGFDMFWNSNAHPDVKLVIVGDGNKKSEYERYAKKLKSAKQIIFVGAKKNPFVYMKHAIANVLSSYSEGLPTVLLESAVVGTLNIASKCRFGPREILLNGRGGVLFEPGNAKQLAMCMGDVYNNSVNVTEMIKESTDALKRFKADEVVNQIISLFS